MRIPSGVVDQVIYFVGVDSVDLKTRETGLATFTVYRSRNGGAATIFTTPTVAELSAVNMPGVYSLLLDEDMTIAAGNDSEEFCVHITHAGMAPVTRTFELYRPKITAGNTLTTSAGGVASATVPDTQKVDLNTIKTQAVTCAAGVTVLVSVGTAATSIAQTGDSFVLVGTAGAGLTAVPWNAAWDAEVQSECNDALVANNLDHLALTGVGIPGPAANTYLAQIMDDGIAAFNRATDSLQAIRDTAPLGTAMRGTDSAALASVCTEARLAELDAANLPATTDAILTDTAEIGTAGAGLTAVPWNANWDAEVQSECNDALVANNLDHLALTATTAADMTAEVVDNTILARVLAGGDTSTFVPTTMSMKYIAERSTASYTVTTTTVGAAPEVNITQYQHQAFGPIAITASVAQTGDSHAFSVYDYSTPGTVLWSLTTAGGEITVGGAGNLTITLQGAVGDPDQRTATAGEWGYVLRNTTDDTVISTGNLTIEPVPTT